MAFKSEDALLPAQAAAGATVETIVAIVPSQFDETNWTLVRTSLVSPSLVTGAATNNVTYNVRQYRAGALVASVNPVATLTLASGTNLAADTEVVVPLAVAQTPCQASDVFTVQMVQSGTGLASPANVCAHLEFE
jgi:hypothetical protein